MPSLSEIQALADKIAREFHPDKIILFGSHARKKPTPDSDVDLLVIMTRDGNSVHDQAVQIRQRITAGFPGARLVRTFPAVGQPRGTKERLMSRRDDRG